jgi:hypothetical protein
MFETWKAKPRQNKVRNIRRLYRNSEALCYRCVMETSQIAIPFNLLRIHTLFAVVHRCMCAYVIEFEQLVGIYLLFFFNFSVIENIRVSELSKRSVIADSQTTFVTHFVGVL